MRDSMRSSHPVKYGKKPRKLTHNTFEYHGEDGSRYIRLYTTDIIEFKANGTIRLDTGGWQTVTTKNRINRFSPCRVWSENSVWLANYQGQSYTFADGMILYPGGDISGAGPSIKDTAKLRRDISKFAKDYMIAFRAGDIPKPSGTAKADTDFPGGKDHILSHIEEKYYVPSILTRAIQVFPTSQAAKHNIAYVWGGAIIGNAEPPGFTWLQIEKSVKRWLYRQCGLAS